MQIFKLLKLLFALKHYNRLVEAGSVTYIKFCLFNGSYKYLNERKQPISRA